MWDLIVLLKIKLKVNRSPSGLSWTNKTSVGYALRILDTGHFEIKNKVKKSICVSSVHVEIINGKTAISIEMHCALDLLIFDVLVS